MKEMKRRWQHAFSVIAVLLGSLVTTQIAFAQSEKPIQNTQKPGMFRLKVTEGHVSLEANQAPLGKIFEEIGKQAKIAVDSSVSPEEKITMHFDRLPLEEGIKQLSKNVTIFYGQDSEGKTRRIAKVVVLSTGNQSASKERVKTLSQPAKVNDPASKPEPFKFEFDPSKSVGKEKSR